MKYFGPTVFPESSSFNGYWVYGSKVYDVSTSTHIKFMLEHLDMFNLTQVDIEKIYAETGEKIGTEGKARELLIKYAATLGWIRVRHYIRPRDFWSIQCQNTQLQHDSLRDFCNWAIEHKIMGYHDDVTFIGYDNPDDTQSFDFMTGGIQNFLMEKKMKNH